MKEKNVINYYVLCNRLKNILRTGWVAWDVQVDRVESIAEHIYGTQMLAIAMYSEYKYDIDINKVIIMLAVHELEEILIGDIPVIDGASLNKIEKGHIAVQEILKNLDIKEDVKNIVFEFDERKTNEAKFAYFIDKLECDLQCKIYQENNAVDLNVQKSTYESENIRASEYNKAGKTWADMWIDYDLNHIEFDDNFKSILDYIKNNDIKE